jgi:histidine triad (HIT) family protein
MGNCCALCHLSENPDQTILFGNGMVLFLQNAKEQGALLGSGVIIPVRHAETIFDLTLEEVCATFELLNKVKVWLDDHYHPDGYNVGWNCGAVAG